MQLERSREFADAFALRTLILAVATMAVALAIFLLPEVDVGLGLLGALPVMVIALSASFYFVGLASPSLLFWMETIPRAAFTAAAAFLLLTDSITVPFALAVQLLGNLCAVLLSGTYVLRSGLWRVWMRSSRSDGFLTLLRRQRQGLASALLAAFFSNAPMLIVTFVAPAIVAPFSVVDRLAKQMLAGSSPVTAVLQGWVPREGVSAVARRARVALAISWLAGVFVALVVAISARPLVHWVAAGEVEPGPLISVLMGSFVGLFLVQNAVSYAGLAAQGRLGVANRSMLVCTPIGLVLVGVLASPLGVVGVLTGICAGMLAACVWQSVAVLR